MPFGRITARQFNRSSHPENRVPVRRRRRRRQRVPRPGTLLGKSKLVTLRYVQQWTLNAGAAGTLDAQVFSASNPKEVTAGTTHQPLGWDQISPLYDHFTVMKSKITVSGVNADPNYSQAVCITLLDVDTEFTGDITQYLEQPGSHYDVFGDDATNSGKVCLRHGYDAKKYWRIVSPAGKDTIIGQTGGSGPSDEAYYHLSAAPLQSVDAGQLDFMVTIDYTILFTEPKKLAQS